MGLEDLARKLRKSIGDNSEEQMVTKWISTGYAPLNKIISGKSDGGIPFGRLVEIYGPSSSGKTAIATQMMVNAQKMGGIAVFLDVERSFSIDMAKNFGLDDTYPRLIYKRPATWEEGNDLIGEISMLVRESKDIPDDAPILFVFDSIAAAVPQSSVDKDFKSLNMNDTTALARVASTTLKSVAKVAGDYNSTVVYLNQIRLKPGVVYGDPTYTPGGKAMEFFASVRLALGRKINKDSSKEFVGQEISIETKKNKLTRPFQTTSLTMQFDENGIGYFDTEASIVDALIEEKKLEVNGAWIDWDGKKYQKKQLIKLIKDENLMDKFVSLLDS